MRTKPRSRASATAPSPTGPERTPPPGPLPPTDILGYGPIAEDLDDGRLGLIWADAYVFADHPDKPFDGEADGEDGIDGGYAFEFLRFPRPGGYDAGFSRRWPFLPGAGLLTWAGDRELAEGRPAAAARRWRTQSGCSRYRKMYWVGFGWANSVLAMRRQSWD